MNTLSVVDYHPSQYFIHLEVRIGRHLLFLTPDSFQYFLSPILGLEPRDSYMLPINVTAPTLYLFVLFWSLRVGFALLKIYIIFFNCVFFPFVCLFMR